MRRLAFLWMGCLGVAVIGAGTLQAARPSTAGRHRQSSSPAPVASQYRVMLNTYCVTCHNEQAKTAGLMLDRMDLSKVPVDAEV